MSAMLLGWQWLPHGADSNVLRHTAHSLPVQCLHVSACTAAYLMSLCVLCRPQPQLSHKGELPQTSIGSSMCLLYHVLSQHYRRACMLCDRQKFCMDIYLL